MLWVKKMLFGVWYNIVRVISSLNMLGIRLSSIFELQVGNRNNTLFWLDDRLGSDSISSKFTILYVLDKWKTCYISARLHSSNRYWEWKR